MEPATEPRKAVSNLVRKYFAAYEAKDRPLMEELLSDDFTFTSPVDNHIDRATYFQKCWPFSEEVRAFHIVKLFEEGNEAFVVYECESKNKPKFRNTEFFRVQGNQIKEVQVYFGALPEGAAKA